MQNSSITNIGFISWSLLKSMSTIYQKGWQLVIRQRTANNNTQIGANQMETDWLSTTETVSGASSSTGMLEIEVMMSSFPKHSLTCPHSYTERSLHFTKCSKKTPFFQNTEEKKCLFCEIFISVRIRPEAASNTCVCISTFIHSLPDPALYAHAGDRHSE